MRRTYTQYVREAFTLRKVLVLLDLSAGCVEPTSCAYQLGLGAAKLTRRCLATTKLISSDGSQGFIGFAAAGLTVGLVWGGSSHNSISGCGGSAAAAVASTAAVTAGVLWGSCHFAQPLQVTAQPASQPAEVGICVCLLHTWLCRCLTMCSLYRCAPLLCDALLQNAFNPSSLRHCNPVE